jgi:hypothetical protein
MATFNQEPVEIFRYASSWGRTDGALHAYSRSAVVMSWSINEDGLHQFPPGRACVLKRRSGRIELARRLGVIGHHLGELRRAPSRSPALVARLNLERGFACLRPSSRDMTVLDGFHMDKHSGYPSLFALLAAPGRAEAAPCGTLHELALRGVLCGRAGLSRRQWR